MLIAVAVAAFLVGLLVGLIVWYLGTRSARGEGERLRIRLTELEKDHAADTEKLQWTEQAEVTMREAFTALASRALRDNTDVLTKQAKSDLQNVVNPLKENLTTLGEHVRQLEKDRKGAYDSLREQLKALGETHSRLQATTISLTQALKSPTVRGRWGELQLRRVVELAGMVNHVSFEEQATGDVGRPDLIVYLPNRGILPIDSKVTLDSYLAAMETTDPVQRKRHLTQHARALRERVRELGLKQYWDQFDNTPDFVVMFVPNEACLGAAFEEDAELLEYAIDKRVLISSPVNLVALLKAVAYGWQQKEMTENARAIAKQGQELYTRMAVFIEHLGGIGKNLSRAVEVYNKAVGSFDRRLAPALRRLQEMGISASELASPETVDLQPTDTSVPERDGDQDA